jgi:hypothetical protein
VRCVAGDSKETLGHFKYVKLEHAPIIGFNDKTIYGCKSYSVCLSAQSFAR